MLVFIPMCDYSHRPRSICGSVLMFLYSSCYSCKYSRVLSDMYATFALSVITDIWLTAVYEVVTLPRGVDMCVTWGRDNPPLAVNYIQTHTHTHTEIDDALKFCSELRLASWKFQWDGGKWFICPFDYPLLKAVEGSWNNNDGTEITFAALP